MAPDPDRARALKAAFERAAAAKQIEVERLEGQKTPGKGADQQRTTSFAKSIDDAALGRARSARDDFRRAAAGVQQDIRKPQTRDQVRPQAPTPQRAQAAQGSSTVKTHAPRPTPNPPPLSKKIAEAQLTKEMADASRKIDKAEKVKEAYENSQKQQKMRDLENDRNKDHDDRSR